MFQNRHPVRTCFPSLELAQGQSHNAMKLPMIPEYLDRLREEYTALQQQVQSYKNEAEKKNQECESITRQVMGMYEMLVQAQMEAARQTEVGKRLNGILQHVIPLLPAEQQASAAQALERTKNVSAQLVQQQQPMPMMPGMPGLGMPPGFNPFFPMKPDDMNAFAAQLSGMNPKGGFPFMPPMTHPLLGMPGMSAPSTSHGDNNVPSSSLNSANRSTSVANSRPHSAAGPPMPKKPKTDTEEDGELEIDVQNDDNAASKSGANGTNSAKAPSKSGRDSASSRDSTSTPKSHKTSSTFPNPMIGMGDLNSLFMTMQGGNRVSNNHMLASNGKGPYAFKVSGGSRQPVQFPTDAINGDGVPQRLDKLAELYHGDVVCAVTVAPVGDRIYTGGKGCIKVWDISRPKETTSVCKGELKCLDDQYIRSCKLLPDNKTLLVGGECKDICVMDVETQTIVKTLDCEAQACYAMVVSADGQHCYSCCADGKIVIWDLVNFERIGEMKGHEDGASCVDLAMDGLTLWTGGLDSAVCTWDLRERKERKKFVFDSQVFSLSCSPADEWVAVGLENSNVEVISADTDEKYVLHEHDNCVLSMKYAHSGKWFMSTGKDSSLITWRSPYGARLVKTKQETSVLSCDVSKDDKYIVTGAGDKRAVLYELIY